MIGPTTRTEYKVVKGVFKKRKVRLCVMGNQQTERVHLQLGEMHTPVTKDAEVRLFIAFAAEHRLNLFKSDTKQAFLNGDMDEEKIYIRPPDWWPEKVLMKNLNMYGTRRYLLQIRSAAVMDLPSKDSLYDKTHGWVAVLRYVAGVD